MFLGAFLLAMVVIQLEESSASIVENFAWVYAVIGITSILVGLETLALVRHLTEPGPQRE